MAIASGRKPSAPLLVQRLRSFSAATDRDNRPRARAVRRFPAAVTLMAAMPRFRFALLAGCGPLLRCLTGILAVPLSPPVPLAAGRFAQGIAFRRLEYAGAPCYVLAAG